MQCRARQDLRSASRARLDSLRGPNEPHVFTIRGCIGLVSRRGIRCFWPNKSPDVALSLEGDAPKEGQYLTLASERTCHEIRMENSALHHRFSGNPK